MTSPWPSLNMNGLPFPTALDSNTLPLCARRPVYLTNTCDTEECTQCRLSLMVVQSTGCRLQRLLLTFLPGLAGHPVPVSISSTSVPPFSLWMTGFFYNEILGPSWWLMLRGLVHHANLLTHTGTIMVACVVRIGTPC